MQSWPVLAVSAVYLAVLFAIAWWGDRRAAIGRPLRMPPYGGAVAFALTLAIYNTSWSFYGSVGRAAASGLDFLPIYIGPTLVLVFGQPVLAKVIAIAKAQNATSIADFIAARYGKSQLVAAAVTVAALVGVLPYIALQLKAVGTSFDVLTAPSPTEIAGIVPFWQDTAFAVALAMAVFTVVFGVRHIHASEHHRGLMLAIAFESLVKLGAFLAVGVFIVYGLFDGFGDLLGRAVRDPALHPLLSVDLTHPTWLSNTLISVIAFLCLPQAFHVAVVENENPDHVRKAAWLYPAYLLILSVFMIPIAVAGLVTFTGEVHPDAFVITLPVAAGHGGAGLLAFIGGLSAATGMVIVAALSLSTMLCNDVVMPVLLRAPRLGRWASGQDLSRILLRVRRIAVVIILLLAYAMYRAVDRNYPLTQIGLISFVAVAQFGPAFLGGLYWRRASRAGALAGMAAGFAVWAYTLLLPSIAPFTNLSPGLLADGPWGIAWLRPQALFGTAALDLISHATLWSLLANAIAFVAVSLTTRQSALERAQAAAFCDGSAPERAPARPWRAVARLVDLQDLASRFVGSERGAVAFADYLEARRLGSGPPLDGTGLADLDAARFTEHLIAGAIGAASARVVMAASLQTLSLSRGAAMAMLDEASEALRFNRHLLQATLESVPQGICVVDEELRIMAWNGRFVRLLGLPGEFVRVGLPLAELIAFNRARGEYGSEDLKALIINRDIPAQTWPYTYERRRPDGTVLEVVYDRMLEGGYVSTYTDVTERHQAAEALREANEGLERRVRERTDALVTAKAEADQANASKTRFLAAASHDLLQPLNAARLFVSALDESLRNRRSLPTKAQRAKEWMLAENAATSLRSAEQLLAGLLDISSLDSGAIRPEVEDFAVGPLLTRLHVEFSAIARERGLELRLAGCAARVRSDPQLLRRVLQNFLSNALRYTSSGRVLFGCRRRDSVLRMEVWDTGPGIPEEKLQEIFEEFRRLDGGERTRDKGLGLGLAIVERIAGLLGLEISVRSTPGRGTCFAVSVPLSAVQSAPAPEIVPARPSFAGASRLLVLCIDNEEAILRGLHALLGEWGHEVVTAFDAAGGRIAMAGRTPDLVLIDYHLGPSTTGLSALAELRSFWDRPVRGLLVTADRSEAVREAAERQGCDLMHKPVKPAALRRYLSGVALQGAGRLEEDAA